MSFFGELKRRKVFRIAGAYLVAAWVVLQVTSTLVPALELPSWTLKLVAVLAIVGFPFALVLGYIFDLTPGGVERTTDSVKFHFPARAAIAGTLIVMTGVVGFLVVRRRLNAAGIDPNSVVVLPFRVSGDAKLAAMGEGMVDLIAPKLTGVGGPRAVDSRTTLSAWRRAIDSGNEDITPKDAIKLARKLKASQVILGEVIAAPGAIALNARVYSTIDGVAGDAAEVKTTQDSLLSAVDLLVAELLSTQAGEKDRLSALLTSSLPAVQAYLDGNRVYRRGQYEEAAKHFATAVDLDSTFALAAYGELMARGWTGFGPRYTRATRLAFNFKDRLPPRERALMVARVGEEYPNRLSYTKSLRGWEQVSTQYPDSPEMWYELGDHYFHYGQPLGLEDHEDRALHAWSRAIALDSTFAPPWEHQVQIHAARGDTARLRAVYAKLSAMEAEEVHGAVGWVYAVATGDASLRAKLLEKSHEWPRSTFIDAILAALKAGVSPVGLDTLMQGYLTSAGTDPQRVGARQYAAGYELDRGRPTRAFAYLDEAAALPNGETGALSNIILHSILHPELGVERATDARRRLAATKTPGVACATGLWDAFDKNTAGAAQMLRMIRDSIAQRPADSDSERFCAQVLQAADAVVQQKPNARAELQRADSLAINGPLLGAGVANFTAAVLSRLYAQIGDFEKARRAALRGGYTTFGMSAQMLEHARMAARTGRNAEAIHSYRLFLAMRDNPEPGPAKDITDKVRAELAALTSR